MIDDHLFTYWEEPHEEMSFEKLFKDLLDELHEAISKSLEAIRSDDKSSEFYRNTMKIYIMTQALPRVMLNYKICIDFGLPLDPVNYIDFNGEPKDTSRYSEEEKQDAQELFMESISTAKKIYLLQPESIDAVESFRANVPPMLMDFCYTNVKDRYTWKASNPEHIRRLADRTEEKLGRIDLIVGAAHGCIRPGIMLSNMLDCEIYFLRYSLFKRKDPEPIISGKDREFLERYRSGKVLLFDEDVAKGQTLKSFVEALEPMFDDAHSASVIRHYLASFNPELVGSYCFD